MQKISTYSLLLSLSLMSLSLHCSTVWIFNKKAISGCVEDEIDKRLKPGLQNEAMRVEISEFKKNRKEGYVAEVEREHQRRHFKTEDDAKAYARELAQKAAQDFFYDIEQKRIAMRMANLPKSALAYKDQLVAAVRTSLENRAYQEAHETGSIHSTLKDLDKLINESLIYNFGWTCDVCQWLYE